MATTAGKALILIVDDIAANIEVLEWGLTAAGYSVCAAQDAEEALEVLSETLPDLIVLDILMPGTDGYELCRQIKNKPGCHDIPVIFVSALSDTVDKVKGFA